MAAGILPTRFQSKTAQIVPSASIAGNALTVVIAIMSFLACLTAGA
ncbi:MAG: ABC transporter permease, partial [Methyloceanibacter sp.]